MTQPHSAMEACSHLTKLPHEILHHVLIWLDPADLSPVSRTCRAFRGFVNGNQKLCQDIYLSRMDVPDNMELDWEAELHDVVKLDRLFRPIQNPDKNADELPFVCDSVVRILKNASFNNHKNDQDAKSVSPTSLNVDYLTQLFDDNPDVSRVFTQQSFLFDRIRHFGSQVPLRFPEPSEKHQLSAKLHCLLGRPILRAGRTRSMMTYPFACSKVYDLRQYTERSMWGPFRDDGTGRVDWEKVEAISILMWKNVSANCPKAEQFQDMWDRPFHGSFPRSFVPVKEPELGPLDAQDPYGVTGSYYRVVCFLDHSDFIHFNFGRSGIVAESMPRPPLSIGEATRLIIMKIHVTRIEPPGPDDGQELPVVHFEGFSWSVDMMFDVDVHSTVHGTVRLTQEGEVRWTSVNAFDGVDRWKSEAVQVGGVRSGRGAVGTWFDRDYDEHGPAGPTAFWKAPDAEDPKAALFDGLSDFLMQPLWTEGVVVTFGDEISGEEIDFDDVEDEEDWDADLDPIEDELPGLLQDAETELSDITGGMEHA